MYVRILTYTLTDCLMESYILFIYLFIRALLTLIVSHPMLPSWRGYLVETHPLFLEVSYTPLHVFVHL
jgi:hypothetical protein